MRQDASEADANANMFNRNNHSAQRLFSSRIYTGESGTKVVEYRASGIYMSRASKSYIY